MCFTTLHDHYNLFLVFVLGLLLRILAVFFVYVRNFYLQKARIAPIVLLIRMSHRNPLTAPEDHLSIGMLSWKFLIDPPVDILVTAIPAVGRSIAEFPNVETLPAWAVELRLFTRTLFQLPGNNIVTKQPEELTQQDDWPMLISSRQNNYLQMTPTAWSGPQRFFWSIVHSPRHFSQPAHWRLPIGLLLSLPAPFITLTTCEANEPSINSYLFSSKMKTHMLADQVGLNFGEGVVAQAAPRSSHIVVNLHYLATALTACLYEILLRWYDMTACLCEILIQSSFVSSSLLTLLPLLLFFSLRPSNHPQGRSLRWRHFRSLSLCETFILW